MKLPIIAFAPAIVALASAQDSPETHEIARGTLHAKVEIEALAGSQVEHAIALDPKEWAEFVVVEAAAHGARVKKGEVILRFESDKLDEAIADLEKAAPAAKVGLAVAETELANLEQSTVQKLEAARRTRRQAEEDLAHFETKGRDLAKLGAHFDVKFAEQLLDNAREELVQLEKMYKADDLTEETEEIILRRQRNAVESAEFRLGRVKVEAEQQLTVGIPRQGEALKAARRDAELAHELAEKNLPRALEQKRFEVDKLRRDNAKAEEKLADLRADRKLAVVKSPAEGILIYGTSEEGAFPGAAGAAKKLVPGGKVAAREIIMTVVDPGKLAAFAKIPEAKLADVAPGREGVAAPEANPAAEIPAKVESLGYIPAVGGGYPAKLSLQPPADLMPPLMPGMKLKVSLGTSEKENVLLAPKSAIFEEDGKSFAYLAKEDGGHEKREVKVGATNGKNLEVKDGLKEGDKILAKKPE